MNTCFGITWLGLCNYNPAAPTSIYFSLGEAVGALAFTLAVQQLLRPIYRFRLAARRLKLSRLYVLVFAGVAATIIAAVLPSLPILHSGPWGYAVVWEIIAALFFVAAYGAVVIAVVRPVRVRMQGIPQFARGVANLLSAANETDHVDLSEDVFASLPALIKAASFLEHRRKTTAFFDFAYRKEISQSSYAISLLQIIADPHFCETLVKRAPWRLADAITQIGTDELYARSAEEFIREVAHQAIIRDDSIVARETGYHGFGTAPLLSEALFSNPFIVIRYNPLESFFSSLSHTVTGNLLNRFNGAAKRCYLTLIAEEQLHSAQVAFSIQSFYRSVFSRAEQYQKSKSEDHDLNFQMIQVVTLAGKLAVRLMASVDPQSYNALFVNDISVHRSDVLETLVEIVDEAVGGIANNFKGVDDPFWMMSMDVVHDIFHKIGEQPDGLTPFQQRLALKLNRGLNINLDGFYPAACRVLLATVGPYYHQAGQSNKTAFNILKDLLYIQLKRFHHLAEVKPEKVSHFLPPNVTYHRKTNRLTHTYRGGGTQVTDLSTLAIPALSLVSKKVRRTLTDNEQRAAKDHYFA
jgi:hypothetical protein